MRRVLIAFQKRDIHTYIHTTLAANPWSTIRDPMPRAIALGNWQASIILHQVDLGYSYSQNNIHISYHHCTYACVLSTRH